MSNIPLNLEDEKLDGARVLREDTKFAAGRIASVQYLIFAVFLYLLSGFWELQITQKEYYEDAAERNRVRSIPVLAPRGKILDRDGRVIVDNHASFSVMLSRENLKPEHLKPIAEGLNLSLDELRSKLKRFDRTRPKYEPIVIKEELTPGEIAFVESHRDPDAFPELVLAPSYTRYYPEAGVASHLIGYVGEISEHELNSADFANAKPGDVVGKAGVERYYNDLLVGIDGQRRVLVDNRGNERSELAMKEAIPGQTLQLTIDLDLQIVAEMALEGKRGAVVALDPRNGEVLAMASKPDYDPNKFTSRISGQDWRAILSDPDKPLLNRAIQAQFAPGSTFKPIVALAGLETGVLTPDFTAHCSGSAWYYGRPFKCHARGGHGKIQLNRALVQSCDVFFYALGNRLGVDMIAKYAEIAGFGKRTGIDLPGESEGIVPSTKWKLRTSRSKWYAGETISVAIGQGQVTVTPLQLAHAIGGLVVGGVWHRPHVVRDSHKRQPARKADLNLDNIVKIIDAMHGVVQWGTARNSFLPGIQLCGKTGTAQLASNAAIKSGALGKNYADNAWFVGFAPKDNPEIVVAALFENGEHGDRAAPIVRDVVKAYFDKKARLEMNQRALAMQRVLLPPGPAANPMSPPPPPPRPEETP
ncbi:MAG: penicillin-binding protein 2 [Bryobacteraceae bacterium]|nr:penicillin-binding protein 2 [Bryobacteraceae bacterium]MDW8376647.1 penicillin-binding protein 2 [Bryobacterales bacterium]